jgi:acyl-CoA synthetase (AMP-forming)/AMP-acid ligase II
MELHTELTIGAYFENKVAERGDADFIVYPDRDLRWSYNQFNERVDNLAKGLLAIGLEPGDSIYYDSIVPHQLRAHGEVPARILAVVYAPA